MASSSSSATSVAAANASAIAAVNSVARPLFQPICAPITLDGSSLGQVPIYARIEPRKVGLLRKILVRVEVDFTVPGGCEVTAAPFGPSALLSNIQFTDLNNNKRIDTSGVHLAMLASVKQRQPAGSAFMTDTPLGFGNNIAGSISLPHGGPGKYTAAMTYEIPIAYQDGDYRGAIYCGTTQSTNVLQLTINPAMFYPKSGADNTASAYIYSGTVPTVHNIRIIPYQDYLDQLPTTSKGQLVLPTYSMSQVYQLIESTQTGIQAGSDYLIDLGNLRTYMSLFCIFDNGGALNPSTDLDNIRIEAANLYQFLNTDPIMMSYRNRTAIGDDLPKGVQYFPFRQQPVNTENYGNTSISYRANAVGNNSKITVLSEFFSNTLTFGASTVGS